MKINFHKRIGFMQGRLSPMHNKKIQSFPWKNWKTELSLCKKINLFRIEWTLDYPNLVRNPLILDPKGTYKILKKFKINMNSVTCDFFMQKPFFKKNYADEKLVIEKIIKKLKKKKLILVIPLVDNSSIKNKKQENKIIKFFKFIYEKHLKKSNLIICFESDYTPNKLKKFISKFPKDKFGINFDTGNSASLGHDCENELKILKKRIYNIHIKDRKFRGKTIKLGEGDFDFNLFLKIIKMINYKGNFVLQTARSKSGRHINELNKNLNFIKNFI